MKKVIITGISLIILSLIFLFVFWRKEDNLHKQSIRLYEITSKGALKEKVNAYIEASYIVTNIANYKEDQKNSFFVIFADNVQYLVYMKNKDAKKINDYLLNNPNKTYRLYGVTKKITDDIKEYGKSFLKTYLDNNHQHEKEEENNHVVTNDDFDHYFGYVYLDCLGKKNTIYCYLSIIIGLSGVIAFIDYGYLIIRSKYENRKA